MESNTHTSTIVQLTRCVVLMGLATANLTGCGTSGSGDVPENLSIATRRPDPRFAYFPPSTFQFVATDYATVRISPLDGRAQAQLHQISLVAIRQQRCSAVREVNFLADLNSLVAGTNRTHRYFTVQTIQLPANTPINLQVESQAYWGRIGFTSSYSVCARAYSLKLKSGKNYELRVDNRWDTIKKGYGCDFDIVAVDYSGSDETKRRSRIVERVHLNPVDLPRC